jgi:hypothetical protein
MARSRIFGKRRSRKSSSGVKPKPKAKSKSSGMTTTSKKVGATSEVAAQRTRDAVRKRKNIKKAKAEHDRTAKQRRSVSPGLKSAKNTIRTTGKPAGRTPQGKPATGKPNYSASNNFVPAKIRSASSKRASGKKR